jgi:hypothetical protein
VQIGSFAIEASDLSSRMTAALEKTISTIDRKQPLHGFYHHFYVLIYHVHILEFIHDIGAHPGSVNTWNAAGNYYFEHDSTKAEAAYNRAIALDRRRLCKPWNATPDAKKG